MQLREQKMGGGWAVDLFEDGKSISRLWIADRQMRIGSSVVQLGGIAGVGTDSQYRKRGLASQVLKASLALMQREGYDASFLYGIPDFYHKFGFVTCMPQHDLELDTRAAECGEKRLTVRAVHPGDLKAIARLYNRDSAQRTASCVRDKRWNGFPMGSNFEVPCTTRVVVDKRERVVGYIVYDDVEDRCRIAELGGQHSDVLHTLLNDMARRAVTLRREKITLSLPPDHPFALFCRDYGCRANTRYERVAGPMGRLINLRPFVEKVLPELAERWGATDRTQRLDIRTDIGHFSLHWQGKNLRVADAAARGAVRLEQTTLTQLFLGYKTAASLQASGELTGSAAQLKLLERLFPLQQAHMSWPDRF
jgi:predicted acetyltransferase